MTDTGTIRIPPASDGGADVTLEADKADLIIKRLLNLRLEDGGRITIDDTAVDRNRRGRSDSGSRRGLGIGAVIIAAAVVSVLVMLFWPPGWTYDSIGLGSAFESSTVSCIPTRTTDFSGVRGNGDVVWKITSSDCS